MSMWEPFTESARRSFVLAQEVAERRGSATIDGEHLLYGIVAEGQTPAALALRAAGVTTERLTGAVDEHRPVRSGGQLVFTPDAKHAIEAAFREARLRNHNFVGTAHLALGAIDAPRGSAVQALHAIGADLADLRGVVVAAAETETRLPAAAFAVDHVQIAIPKGGESQARGFYGGLIGLPEIEKPAHLGANGGVWFGCGPVQLHLGVDPAFSPSEKAHVALRCSGYGEIVVRLRDAGHTVTDAPEPLPSGPHAYVQDPFGNRLELVAQLPR